MAPAKATRTRKRKASRSSSNPRTPKINEFEVWSDFNELMAKLVAQKMERLTSLAEAMKPGKSSYSLGDFLQDQLRISTKFLEAYLKASKTQ